MAFLAILGSLFFCWMLYRVLKADPSLLSKENVSRSLLTLGFLALGLMALIAVVVLFLRH